VAGAAWPANGRRGGTAPKHDLGLSAGACDPRVPQVPCSCGGEFIAITSRAAAHPPFMHNPAHSAPAGSLDTQPPETAVASPDRATFEAHLARRHYGGFTLTAAVRPAWQSGVVPAAGYRHDSYLDPGSGDRLPALLAAISSEQLFDTFLQLLEPLGESCDVVVESSHDRRTEPESFTREGIERVLLESLLWDFEDLLLNDGCTGIAVMHPEAPLEVQLDEHKLLVTYSPDRATFEWLLRRQGLTRNDSLRVISQGDHMHTSSSRYHRRFGDLVQRLHAE